MAWLAASSGDRGEVVSQSSDSTKVYANSTSAAALPAAHRSKWVKGEVEISATDLVTKHKVYPNTAAAIEAFTTVSSDTGGAPKLGSVEERGVGKKVKWFVKLRPDTAAGFEELSAKLCAVGVQLDDYLPDTEIIKLCRTHKFVVPGYDVGDEAPPRSPAESVAG